MKKSVLKTATIMLLSLAAGSLVSCGKEKEKESTEILFTKTKGTIVGYHKCLDHENGGIVFGLYIVTEEDKSILAYNIPHKTLNALLETNVDSEESFLFGSYPWGHGSRVDYIQITFEYRKAKEDEIVNVVCGQFFMLPTFSSEGFEQVIISNINKEDTK